MNYPATQNQLNVQEKLGFSPICKKNIQIFK